MAEVYEFGLTLEGDCDDLTDELLGRLHAAGCDDGTVAWQNGRLFIAFDREAASLEEAIASATADVRRAGYEVKAVP